MTDPIPVDHGKLLVYFIGRIDNIERMLDGHVETAKQHRKLNNAFNAVSLAGTILRWGGIVTTQVSTIFIAGYVAVEHTWYVNKIERWISTLLSWHL